MAILVTGGAGYIGSVTVERLTAKGERVVVLDDLVYGHRESIDADIPFYQGSVGDQGLLARITKEHKIESCVHFAALAYVGESVEKPASYFENNVQQGISLVSALVDAGVRRFIFSSSCTVYGDQEKSPIGEDFPQWPKNPYGWTKFTLERLLEAYDTAYGLKSICLRYFNAAGATQRCGEDHDPETHLIPNVLAAAADPQKEVRIFGNQYPTPDGTAIRDYIHVADLADAHIRALEHLRGGGASDALNLGTGRGHSVLEVIETARRVTELPIRTLIEGPRPGDPATLVADPSRAKALLGWQATMSDLNAIVESAWAWRKKCPGGYSSHATAK
ncbi:MAG: UDP-glucose 4-epimerase GalE [Candidatus Acidiferrales bacterium]